MTVLTGWQTDADPKVWLSDVSGILLSKPVADVTGSLGFTWSPKGLAPGDTLATAGYPQVTMQAGHFFKWSAPCHASDGGSNSGTLHVNIGQCAITEPGQSGSALRDGNNKARERRGRGGMGGRQAGRLVRGMQGAGGARAPLRADPRLTFLSADPGRAVPGH